MPEKFDQIDLNFAAGIWAFSFKGSHLLSIGAQGRRFLGFSLRSRPRGRDGRWRGSTPEASPAGLPGERADGDGAPRQLVRAHSPDCLPVAGRQKPGAYHTSTRASVSRAATRPCPVCADSVSCFRGQIAAMSMPRVAHTEHAQKASGCRITPRRPCRGRGRTGRTQVSVGTKVVAEVPTVTPASNAQLAASRSNPQPCVGSRRRRSGGEPL
jgi:hypothetical protein